MADFPFARKAINVSYCKRINTMADPKRELALFQDFAGLLGLPITAVSNPNAPGRETGMDVVTVLDGKSIGAQITDYHADEGQTPGKRGSVLRKEEQAKAEEALKQSGPKVYGSWAPGNFVPPLSYRISDKISKANKHAYGVDELWLLVCAQDARYGATGSTFIASAVVSLDVLNRHLNPLLHASPFSRAFLFLYSERVVYGWAKDSDAWQLLKDKTELDKEHIRHMQELIFGRGKVREQWLSNPEGMSARSARGGSK
jgi:hypothetical protein